MFGSVGQLLLCFMILLILQRILRSVGLSLDLKLLLLLNSLFIWLFGFIQGFSCFLNIFILFGMLIMLHLVIHSYNHFSATCWDVCLCCIASGFISFVKCFIDMLKLVRLMIFKIKLKQINLKKLKKISSLEVFKRHDILFNSINLLILKSS